MVIGAGCGAYVDRGVYHYIDVKNWPVENWIAIANKLVEDGYVPILLGGPADKKKINDKAENLSEKVIDLVGKTSLGQSMAVVSKCDLLISGDTGLLHGSHLVGTPVLGLFGGTDPEIIFPKADRNRFIFTSEPCAPCWNSNEKKKQCKGAKCMKNIAVEMVHKSALEMLRQGKRYGIKNDGA